MLEYIRANIEESIAAKEKLLRDEALLGTVEKAARMCVDAYQRGNKLLICGNGGSAADSEHIVGELMKGFLLKRRLEDKEREIFRELGEDYFALSAKLQKALPAISLAHQSALNTAYANDVSPDMVFGQQVYGYGEGGRDVLLAISTSGSSVNVVNAVKVARTIQVATLGLTDGNKGDSGQHGNRTGKRARAGKRVCKGGR